MPENLIEAHNLVFAWQNNQQPVLRLDAFSIAVQEKVFIKGPSGCGKSTLLSLLGGVVTPQQGEVKILRQVLSELTQGDRDRFRADHIGFVFQMFNLIPYLSVIENVLLSCRFSAKRRERLSSVSRPADEARRILEHLGLGGEALLHKGATELSVGQQQRVAVARALIGAPEIVVADEPTSAMDAHLRDNFIRLLMQECEQNKTTLLFVSHDGGLAHHFDRVVDFELVNHIH